MKNAIIINGEIYELKEDGGDCTDCALAELCEKATYTKSLCKILHNASIKSGCYVRQLKKEENEESIKTKAKEAADRAGCDKCELFWVRLECLNPQVEKVCYRNYIKGYLKGYNQRRKEENEKIPETNM